MFSVGKEVLHMAHLRIRKSFEFSCQKFIKNKILLIAEMPNIKEHYCSIKQLKFEKIKNKYLPIIKGLQTYNDELKKFLCEDALLGTLMCINNTYLIFDKRDFTYNHKSNAAKMQLLGYVTLTNDSISLNRKLKETFRDKGINYRSLPALKIGRLCVDSRYERRNIGRLIVAFCIKRACFLNQGSACRFITVDAKRNQDKNQDSYHFYKKLNFEILEHKDKNKDEFVKQTSGTMPMFFDIYKILQEVFPVIVAKFI
jgi:ribosomal protein S18 acetylase RimI-like enzyme